MQPLNVLSLFDGISAGQLALKRAQLPVANYYASEIDEACIHITQKNFPSTIQIGDATKIVPQSLPKIDLLLGGSPCTAFSLAGKKLGFNTDIGRLFYEYVRLLNTVQPSWFLFENVNMKPEHREVITQALNVEPVIVNSSKFSAQLRKRLYWTNIKFDIPKDDSPIQLNDILEFGVSERKKAYCLTAKYADITINPCDVNRYYTNSIHQLIPDANGKLGHRKLTPVECERLQTFPDGYTSGVADKQRLRMLGNSWTVDTITHIFNHLK